MRTRSVLPGVLVGFVLAAPMSAMAGGVCSYTVRPNVTGFLCPFNGVETACVTTTTATGPCDAPLRCFGGSGFFCDLRLSAPRGPLAQCPLGSKRLPALRCIADRSQVVVAPTATATSVPTATPTNTAPPAPAPGNAPKSGPIAVSADGQTVVAVNTDTDSVSLFAVLPDGTLDARREIPVDHEPRSVALLPDTPRAYVANTVSGTLSVIDLNAGTVVQTIPVGTEPWAVVASPNGHFVYVANANDNTVSVIDTAVNAAVRVIPVGRSPRALAVTDDGDADDTNEKLYVPNFFSRPRPGFVPPDTATLGGSAGSGGALPTGATGQSVIGEGMFDDAREGVIDVIDTGSNTVIGQVHLAPLANAGFNLARGGFVSMAAGDAPRTIFADGGVDGTLAQPTGAFPNMLLSIALFEGRGFVPNSAASPEPPLRFNGNVQSLLSVFDTATDAEIAAQTFNLNRGINFDLPAGLLDAQVRDNTDRLFPSAPVDIACSEVTGACWVVSQGSDFVVRVGFTAGVPDIGAPTMAGPFPVSPVVRIPTIDTADPLKSGRNPRGIALNADGTRGYVVCPTTRDVVVMDLTAATVLQHARSADLPAGGSIEEQVRRGKIDFFTSRPPWSDRGWGGCWSCHPDGRTDNVTWAFEAGPRQTISLDGTFNHMAAGDQRALNWTPVRDENQDFELNTRGVFGGRGFITVATDLNGDGLQPDSDPNVRNFGPASSNRASQQEDITAFLRLGIRAPIAPPSSSGNPAHGRAVFGGGEGGANCVVCHSGGKWSVSRVTYDPALLNPVPGTDTGIANAVGGAFLNGFNSAAGAGRLCEVPPPPGAVERLRIMHQVGTFTAANPVEVRGNAISPINTVAPALAVVAAFGGDGFNPPSLLGVFDSAPYFHNGAAATLEEAFGIGTNPTFLAAVQAHWRAGTGGAANVLDSDPTAVTDLIAFLRTIDESTPTFPAADVPPDDAAFADATALCDCQKDPPQGTPALDCTP